MNRKLPQLAQGSNYLILVAIVLCTQKHTTQHQLPQWTGNHSIPGSNHPMAIIPCIQERCKRPRIEVWPEPMANSISEHRSPTVGIGTVYYIPIILASQTRIPNTVTYACRLRGTCTCTWGGLRPLYTCSSCVCPLAKYPSKTVSQVVITQYHQWEDFWLRLQGQQYFT